MRYLSTRGQSPEIGFRQAVLSGLAPDGGLYMPAEWPRLSGSLIRTFADRSFADVAAEIISRFADPDLSFDDLLPMAARAFGAFDAPDVTPLTHIGGEDYLLELYHGPTLAFKDVAMRMLAELYEWALTGRDRGKTIVGATSGDTGGAAISAFAGSAKAEVFMLHPNGRISGVQRRMMTTVDAKNIVNIAVEGSFDDCQSIVKKLFADDALNSQLDLGGVNSINWVRLAVQTVYYFTATARLGGPATFVVPTGNFGDVFAGYAAKQMGLPVNRLAVAVNSNDIMRRVLTNGEYEPSSAKPTSSPSMDIQVASNFERLLFEAFGRDWQALSNLMEAFERDGRMTLPTDISAVIAADFCAESASETEVTAKIRSHNQAAGVMIDPHTAVGLVALDKLRRNGKLTGPAVSLATAHPAKFPDAVEMACGRRPDLPTRFDDLMGRAERILFAPADPAAIREIVLQHSRFS